MVFENLPIDTTQLPTVRQADLKKLAPASKTTEYIGTCVLFGFLLIGASIFFYTASPALGVLRYGGYVLWILLFTLSMSLISKRYEMAGYTIRERDVIHQEGIWWQTLTTVPFNRIQHCEISQGPIQSAFGLATLRIFTAGGTNSDLAIDGLAIEEARLIKDFITSNISGQYSADSAPSTDQEQLPPLFSPTDPETITEPQPPLPTNPADQ